MFLTRQAEQLLKMNLNFKKKTHTHTYTHIYIENVCIHDKQIKNPNVYNIMPSVLNVSEVTKMSPPF